MISISQEYVQKNIDSWRVGHKFMIKTVLVNNKVEVKSSLVKLDFLVLILCKLDAMLIGTNKGKVLRKFGSFAGIILKQFVVISCNQND